MQEEVRWVGGDEISARAGFNSLIFEEKWTSIYTDIHTGGCATPVVNHTEHSVPPCRDHDGDDENGDHDDGDVGDDHDHQS